MWYGVVIPCMPIPLLRKLTGNNVTECVGGARQLADEHLSENYQTTCDPRLNAEQSLEMAFQIAEMIRN